MGRSARARSARAGDRRAAAAAAPTLAGAFVQESVGVALLGLACFAALALWSYVPTDPALIGDAVMNRAGRLGATIAAGLVSSVGSGAYLLVALVAGLGVRLMAGRGLPPLSSRLGVGAPLLIAALATIPALLGQIGSSMTALSGGALGEFLATSQAWLLGVSGALVLNAVLACVGVLAAKLIEMPVLRLRDRYVPSRSAMLHTPDSADAPRT